MGGKQLTFSKETSWRALIGRSLFIARLKPKQENALPANLKSMGIQAFEKGEKLDLVKNVDEQDFYFHNNWIRNRWVFHR